MTHKKKLRSKKKTPAKGKVTRSSIAQKVGLGRTKKTLDPLTPEIVDVDDRLYINTATDNSKALAPSDPLVKYLESLRKYKLLTREEEHQLAVRYFETGDKQAAETLVTSNLRFVVKVAAEYARFGAKLIDLIQEGNVGLMHAVREFNPYKGTKLITYAVWWIKGYIQEYLMRQYSMVRIGTTASQRKLFYQLQKEREELERMGFDATPKQISGRLGVSEKDVISMDNRMGARDVSLDQPLGEEDSSTLLDFQTDREAPLVDEQLSLQEELARLKNQIDEIRPQLNDREIDILDNRLLSEKPATLQDLGDKYGVTREAVRQLEVKVIQKIKSAMNVDTDS